MKLRLLLALCAGIATTSPAIAADPSPAAPAQTYAVIIGGLAGPKPYGDWYADWTGRFQKYLLNDSHVPSANITLLTGDAATSDAITSTLGKVAQQIKPQDQFILFIVGHGEINNINPSLILKGPDMDADQLAAALNGIGSKHQVILNFSASSGDFLKHIVSPDRVNIAATSPTELNEPVFAEFFLRGLESKRAATDKAAPVNLLAAYNWAAQQTALWIVRWQQTNAEANKDSSGPSIWKANGKETVEIFEKLYANVPSRKLDPKSDRNAEDAPPALSPPNGEVTAEWANRRVVSEHAQLEDNGQQIGVSVLGDNGLQPILGGKSGDPGFLAKSTILGKPAESHQ